MAENDDKPDPDNKPDDKPDPDAGAKKALDGERKARRDAEKAANDLRAKLKELEDRDKSDGEKLAGKIAEAEERASKAEARANRLQVAIDKGLSAAQAKRLVGSTVEELEADADEILETFPGSTKPADATSTDDGKGDGKPPSKQPTENLRGGLDPTKPADGIDVTKLAEAIPRP